MTPGDRDALNALTLRLRHVEAIANLIARHCDLGRDESDGIAAIAMSIGDVGDRLHDLIDQDEKKMQAPAKVGACQPSALMQ